jgi:hypothetical protein
LTPAFEAYLSHGEGARGFIDEIKKSAIDRGREFEAIRSIEVDLPGVEGSRGRSLAPIEHVDSQHLRIETILITRNHDCWVEIAILGVEPNPDNFPLMHG